MAELKHIKQPKRKHAHHRPITKADRDMFWKMIARKGGIHIRF
jgi:hypothetical protein